MRNPLGSSSFGSVYYAGSNNPAMLIALIGDASDHGGTLTSSNQDGTVDVGGTVVCVSGANHSCPITGHGTTTVTAITTKSYINGKLILTKYARAGCGAKILPAPRGVTVE
jgi:uncharacterized Zn-binding protein involved in type VI secretion